VTARTVEYDPDIPTPTEPAEDGDQAPDDVACGYPIDRTVAEWPVPAGAEVTS
jgi:hypothetical protein